MHKIVIASGNKGKIREISEILKGYEILSCKDVGFFEEIEENGNSFYENALIKAKTVCQRLNVVSLADDSGLCVSALDGAPGIYSARYSGIGTDEGNRKKLLEEMKAVTDRRAKFVSVIVVCFPDGRVISAEGETTGKILFSEDGENGFCYDSVFYSDDLKKSFGRATQKEKNSVSHRARALNNLKESIKAEFDER